ncbi:hypothetical protein [Roseibium salinum]|uniref:Uncharacterized protein n=1 Tax=Roseibium salinum TaxID=1604349 RepID=A0ABT3R9W5_9HYPH|nr:hypothetical protein [Roseibium sp. DSM 29163]MCX2725753.1 hypothetical protein [Roseibium sp. DSM 29163]
MNTPEWLKPAILGAAAGAIAVGIIGFSWGGWVTGGTATKMANAMSRDSVTAALVPVCVNTSRADVNRTDKLATIRDASAYQRRNALMETGWATAPGADAPSRDLAAACLDALEL